MAKFEFSTQINAPVDRVFEVFTDLRRATERIPAIKKLEVLTEGPIGKGTRFRETRVMFGKEATETMEFTEFQPGKRCAIGADSCGSRFETAFSFRPEGNGTFVEQITTCTPRTLMAKLMMPLGMLLAGPMKKAMRADLDALKHAAEAR
ncbi:MAG TPA: hypothetical protein DEB06_03860 [Phycisphaerales bacterium]|nr:hypothetical protein [Phycisphaerales bacterium]